MKKKIENKKIESVDNGSLCLSWGLWKNKGRLKKLELEGHDKNYEHQWKKVRDNGPRLTLVYCIKCGKIIFERKY